MWRLLLILGLIATAPAAATEISVVAAGAKLHLPLPDGYCGLDPERARESTVFDRRTSLMLPGERLLALALDCRELAAFRDRHQQFSHYLSFSLPLRDDKPVHIADAGRAEYLADLSARMPHVDLAAASDPKNNRAKSADALLDVRRMAAIGQDESAVYFGHIIVVDNVRTLAVATAVTAVGGLVVSAEFKLPYEDDHTLDTLLDQARHEAPLLVAANAPIALPALEPIAPATAHAASTLSLGGFFDGKTIDELTAKLGRNGLIAAVMALGLMLFSLIFLLMTRPSR
jgi:hypothetical protein